MKDYELALKISEQWNVDFLQVLATMAQLEPEKLAAFAVWEVMVCTD